MKDPKRLEMMNADERLNSEAQQAIRQTVRALPEETVSLAWRSALNERVLQEAQLSKRRQRLAWLLRPAVGLAMAGAMAFVVVMRTPETKPISIVRANTAAAGLEAALVSTHRETAMLTDVAGVGLNATEVEVLASDEVPPTDWSEADFDGF
jgi:hypothetical protein